jgi:hypothetical protein
MDEATLRVDLNRLPVPFHAQEIEAGTSRDAQGGLTR